MGRISDAGVPRSHVQSLRGLVPVFPDLFDAGIGQGIAEQFQGLRHRIARGITAAWGAKTRASPPGLKLRVGGRDILRVGPHCGYPAFAHQHRAFGAMAGDLVGHGIG